MLLRSTGIANSGFGVITGGVNVVIQFFKNLGLTVANIAEETITFQMDNLMYFKIKTDSSHFYLLFCYLP